MRGPSKAYMTKEKRRTNQTLGFNCLSLVGGTLIHVLRTGCTAKFCNALFGKKSSASDNSSVSDTCPMGSSPPGKMTFAPSLKEVIQKKPKSRKWHSFPTEDLLQTICMHWLTIWPTQKEC